MPDSTLIDGADRFGKPRKPGRPPAPLLRTTVGEVLRRLRLGQRRTLADVAKSANVSMPYLSELERGRKEASSEVLAALCAALGIGLPELIDLVGYELATDSRRRASVIRLDRAILDRAGSGPSAPPAGSGPASPVALLAA
jgi:transcriptional regulator with XRE-family HTH domain